MVRSYSSQVFTLKKCTENAALGENDEFSHEFGGKSLTEVLPNQLSLSIFIRISPTNTFLSK